MDKQQAIDACTVEGNVVKLPSEQLDRSVYMEVKKALEGIGGKWKGGKVYGFEFRSDPTAFLERVQSGEKINLKKDFQFFATPPDLADRLVDLMDFPAQILRGNLPEGVRILEPSAGDGALIKAIHRAGSERIEVYAIELMPENREILKTIPNVVLGGTTDFLEYEKDVKFRYIIANPPFTRDADIDHIRKMYDVLEEGGRMVTIASNSWTFGDRYACKNFREWLEEKDATIETITMGAFKESGTMVGGKIIIIDK